MFKVQPEASAAPSARSTISGADQMVDRIHTASLDKLIAALPAAVDQSMRKALPHRHTPELAAQFAQTMADELRATYAQRTQVTA